MTALYSLALFVGAALLFALEPMVGKFLLPPLGSTPAVWNTTVLFFQATLLAGYLYSHLTSRLRWQKPLHVAVLAIGVVSLPIAVAADVTPSSHPVLWLIGLLAVTAGLPFFALAANGPMLQRWFGGRDPYFLFAASNAGSFAGLLAYPLLVEPNLTLREQGRAWGVGYGVAALLVVLCAVASRRRATAEEPVEPAAAAAIDNRRRLMWLALAFVPSSLMLGVTTYATRDLTPFPLLWVLPLAIYLLTFVVAFAPRARPERLARIGRIALPGIAIVVVYTLAIGSQRPLWLLLPLHLAVLAAAALMCHARLAADRPAASRLTEFYVWVALGGVLGGVFNALLAPVVFPGLVEYPLALVAACLLRLRPPTTRPALLEFFFRDPRPTKAMDVVVPLLFAVAVTVALELASSSFDSRSIIIGLACGLALNLSKRPLRLGLALGAILLAVTLAGGQALERSRSFFGIYKVERDGANHLLYDGTTVHGLQRVGSPEPLEYYGRAGPAGQAFAALRPRSVGAVGLGAGAIACYGHVTFFEIDPEVVRIARDPRLFTYLRDCPSDVLVGDGRRLLSKQPPGRFDLIVVDAFNSDAIPVHLITRQALALYLSRADAVMFHISNRYLRLEPVLGNLARDGGLVCRAETHKPTAGQLDSGLAQSKWAVLARTPAGFGRLTADARWHPCASDASAHVWTDDYSDLLSAIAWD
ncbi:MAG: hypothetical protein QOH76_4003 [Thermoleophilaceae bacterium]|nr:hypothetical protein [Thermoleophilaceae bacterium]